MIYSVLIINNVGQVRLSKFYADMSPSQQKDMTKKCYDLIMARPAQGVCNFITTSFPGLPDSVRLSYRHYATLFFIFIADTSESELGMLDLIQVFVEGLDRKFENVCELDIVFSSTQVHYLLDEVILGGLVIDTNMRDILETLHQMEQLDLISK